MRTQISHSFEFRSGGNAVPIQVSGWSKMEPEQTWAVGGRSVVVIDNVVAPYGFFLEIDWQPFVAQPYLRFQSVIITTVGQRLSPYRLTQREVAAFYCPPPSEGDRQVLITFEYPDAGRVDEHFDSSDDRELAVAFRRLRILPLLAPPPVRLRNGSAAGVAVRGEEVRIQGRNGEVSSKLQQLVTQFEMLAGNCDMGLAMRALGCEQLSLLRFAGATVDVAMRGLETDFEHLGQKLTAEIADNPIREWMIRDAFGLRFHTHQSSDVMPEQEILKRQQLHINFLRRKFLEDVTAGEKIFIYADHIRERSFESALALFLSLNRRGGRKMLWVCPNVADVSPGRVDEMVPGFARGSLDLFGGPMEAGHIAVSGWVSVLANAAVVLNRT